MVESLSNEEQAQIAAAREKALQTAAEAFQNLDKDGNGFIDKEEARSLANDQDFAASRGKGKGADNAATGKGQNKE